MNVEAWGLKVADLVDDGDGASTLRISPASGGQFDLRLTAADLRRLRAVLNSEPRQPAGALRAA